MNSEPPILSVQNLSVFMEESPILRNVSADFRCGEITALIGPRGSGKTTFLNAVSRMLELFPETRVEGRIRLNGHDVYGEHILAEEVRRCLSYMGSSPVCFPRTIWENVAWGAKINRTADDIEHLVETSLREAGLWNEVKGMLRKNALRLSGGQRQRLCLARALAVSPDMLLLDEPTRLLDPIAAGRIEDVLISLKNKIGIILVTHDHLQAGRLAERTGLLLPGNDGCGELVEFNRTETILVNPEQKRTEDYITGKHAGYTRYQNR